MDASPVIARNFPWCPENDDMSFGGRLHEEGFWCCQQYWLLELALHRLCSDPPSREPYWRVFKIFSDCSAKFGYHFDPNDGCEIRNVRREEIYDARERFQLVFEGFFEGTMAPKDCFEPVNPLLMDSRN